MLSRAAQVERSSVDDYIGAVGETVGRSLLTEMTNVTHVRSRVPLGDTFYAVPSYIRGKGQKASEGPLA